MESMARPDRSLPRGRYGVAGVSIALLLAVSWAAAAAGPELYHSPNDGVSGRVPAIVPAKLASPRIDLTGGDFQTGQLDPIHVRAKLRASVGFASRRP